MDRKLKIIRVGNPFNRINRQVSVVPFNGESLAEIRLRCAPKDVDFVVSLNGKIIPEHDQTHVALRDGDHITLVPRVAGDNPLATLAMIAIVVVAVATGQVYGATLAFELGVLESTATMMITMGINLVGGLIVNALLPPPEPQKPGAGDTSPGYAWNPQTVQEQGGAIPKMYGLNKCCGNIISANLETVNDQQHVNVLIDLGLGPVNRLYDYKINDQPVGNFRGVEIHGRLGYLDQTAIPNFNDTKIEYVFSRKVSCGAPVTVATQRDDFDGLEVDLLFPQGLWYATDFGEIAGYSVSVRVLAKLQGTSTWIILTQSGTDLVEHWYGGRWSAGYYTSEAGIGDGTTVTVWYELADGGTDTYAHHDGEPYGGGYWRWIQNGTEIVATHIIDNVAISDRKTSAVRRTFRRNGLAHGVYDIYVEKMTPDQNSTKYGDEVYLAAVREVLNDDFEYPRRVLVGIRALASDQLSGSLRFSCRCEGAIIRVYDGANWGVAYSNNDAWACFDALTQPVFDNNWNVVRYDGVDPSRLDIPKFYEWAQECDALVPNGSGGTEKKFTFDGSFDTEGTLWDAVLRIGQAGRATPVWTGSNLTLAIDKAASPVALFTVGNIGIDSFKAPFLPLANRASEIEIDFLNQDQNLERDTFPVYDPDLDGIEKVTMNLLGVIRPSEAWRAAKYRLNCNKYLKRSAEIEVDADALACTIGDVVNVAHDVPQWGYSGRIVSARTEAGNLKITLDREVTVEAGKIYEIQYRLNDDTLVTKIVLDGPGTYTEIMVAGEEIVLNGGFETSGAGGADVFFDWAEVTNSAGNFVRDAADKYAGAASLRIDSVSGLLWLQQLLSLVSGYLYRLKFYYKMSGIGVSARMDLRTWPEDYWLQADGSWDHWGGVAPTPSWDLAGATGWTLGEIEFTAPASGNYILFLVCSTPGGSVWFDDFSIMRIPEAYAPFSFGESLLSVKPFRVVNMERSQDLKFRLALAEYNASVYASDNDEPVLPTPNYSALEIVGPVLALTCEEKLIAGKGGIETVIDVSFQKPVSFLFAYAEIWFSKNSGAYTYAGRSVDGIFRISPAEDLAAYRIKAVSVNSLGTKQSFNSAPEAALVVMGKTAPPEDVSEFWFEPSQGGVKLTWLPVSDIDLDYYLVKWHPDTGAGTWGTALEVARVGGNATSLSLPAAKDGIYFIKAVDLSGNESAAAKSVITTIPSILNWNAQAHLEQEPSWGGTKTGMSANGGDLYLDSGTAFDDVADLDALPNLDYGAVAVPAVGYYEIGPVDLGTVQDCRCYGELTFYAVDRETGFDDIADLNALDSINGADVLGVGMLLQVALSQDGAAWGDWQKFLVGDYRARSFKFRLKAWSDFATRYVYADALHIGIDMPERVERGDGVSIASEGTAITFAVPFLVRPQIGVAIESAASGDTVKLSSQSETGFTLQVLNGGSGAARTADWRAVGY